MKPNNFSLRTPSLKLTGHEQNYDSNEVCSLFLHPGILGLNSGVEMLKPNWIWPTDVSHWQCKLHFQVRECSKALIRIQHSMSKAGKTWWVERGFVSSLSLKEPLIITAQQEVNF